MNDHSESVEYERVSITVERDGKSYTVEIPQASMLQWRTIWSEDERVREIIGRSAPVPSTGSRLDALTLTLTPVPQARGLLYRMTENS